MVCSSTIMRFATLALVLLCTTPTYAEQKAAPDQKASGLAEKPKVLGARLGALGLLHEQKLLIKAQVELMNAQAQLKDQGVTTAKIEASYAPTVKMVQGVGEHLFATFLYPGNMAMDARVGDIINGGYKVESISVDQVVLSKDGERLRLGFSAGPPTPIPTLDQLTLSGVPTSSWQGRP